MDVLAWFYFPDRPPQLLTEHECALASVRNEADSARSELQKSLAAAQREHKSAASELFLVTSELGARNDELEQLKLRLAELQQALEKGRAEAANAEQAAADQLRFFLKTQEAALLDARAAAERQLQERAAAERQEHTQERAAAERQGSESQI